ncbi:hypothetical protein TNCV_1689041 [Trichonephila clavipes]|nr:hypothetical protein TNCV_1689041 [Trichonephila clavipes]
MTCIFNDMFIGATSFEKDSSQGIITCVIKRFSLVSSLQYRRSHQAQLQSLKGFLLLKTPVPLHFLLSEAIKRACYVSKEYRRNQQQVCSKDWTFTLVGTGIFRIAEIFSWSDSILLFVIQNPRYFTWSQAKCHLSRFARSLKIVFQKLF